MEAYLDWQNKSGGIKLNDVIEDFKYVYKGQEIKAGDLVNYINGVAGVTEEISIDTALSTQPTSGNEISAVALDNNRVFVAHGMSSNYDLWGMIVTINGAQIIAGEDVALGSGTGNGAVISVCRLSENKVFIAHNSNRSNYYLNALICTIEGATIIPGTDTSISTTSNTGGRISTVLLNDGKIFISHSYGADYYLYGIVCTISGTTITKGTDTLLTSSSIKTGYTISACLLSSGKVFIAHSYSDKYYLYGMVVTINGTSISKGTDTVLGNAEYYTALEISVCELSSGKMFIAHSYNNTNYYLYGMVVNISGTTITKGTDTKLSTIDYAGFKISTVRLNDNKVFIAHSHTSSKYYLYGMVCTISDTTIAAGESKQLAAEGIDFTGSTIASLLLNNGTIFIAHEYTSANRHLYAQIWGIDYDNNIPTNNIVIAEYEQQVTPAIEPPFNAIALSSGVGGTGTEHNEQVKIARPNVGVI